MVEADYPADSPFIAQLHTHTSAESDWREKLKSGDEIDVMDKYKCWSTGTVVWVDPRFLKNEDDISMGMPMMKVGFRQYQEDGDKKDEVGAFFGYSSALDEIIGMWSARIQKPGTQT